MFVRTKKRDNGKTYIQIVESVREKNKVRQKVIRSLGVGITKEEVEQMIAFGESLIVEMKNRKNPVLPGFDPYEIHQPKKKKKTTDLEEYVNIKKLRHSSKVNDGYTAVFGDIFEELALKDVLKTQRKTEHWNELLKACVIARISEPQSKLQTAELLATKFGLSYSEDQIYRLLDHLHPHEDSIKKKIAAKTSALFEEKVDVLFFDVTTLSFESIDVDELRKFGFSKDCKFKETQVVLALVTTTSGLPLTYKVFPGNVSEGKTLIHVIQSLKEEYAVRDLLLVADRAMFSKENLDLMDAQGVKYIVAAKIKSFSKAKKTEILDAKHYALTTINKEFQWVGEFEHESRRLIVSLSSKRAAKDEKDRLRLVERLLKKTKDEKINLKDLIPNYGTKKYLTVLQGRAEINYEKIEEDSKWDGIHGVITNLKEESVQEVLRRYRGLWQIEEAFRVQKHSLKIRPIFHWNPQRIRSHILLCFISYAVLKYSLFKLEKKGIKTTLEQLRKHLDPVERHTLKDLTTTRKYIFPSQLNKEQARIFSALEITRDTSPMTVH